MNIKNLYLALAVIGAAIPYYFFTQHFNSVGYGFLDFVGATFVNPAASGFTADLLISSFIFWIAMFHKRSQGDGPKPALFILLNLFIGLSCALPAYLYASLRRQA